MNKQAVPLNSLTSVTNGGHIIYLFEDFDRYVDNAVSYIITGIDHGHHILLIEQVTAYDEIMKRLTEVISNDQLGYLHYANNVEYYGSRGDFDFQHILTHFQDLMGSVQKKNESIRTWANVMTWGEHSEAKIQDNLIDYERQTCGVVQEFGMVSVCAYNAATISSSLQLKLMREHEYMMTDVEFVKSPLYSHQASEDVVFPSLSVQRRLLNEQKHLLIEKEAVELANQVKNEFIATMNHEIRTPMNGVMGITELLAATDLSDKQKEYVATLQKSGKSLLRIVNDILDYSKLDSNHEQLLKEAFSVREAITETLEILHAGILNKKLQVNVFVDIDVPEILIGDDGRFRQVILNLLGNALKFTNEGSINVVAKLLSSNQSKVRLQITVKDTGIGIPLEKRSQLFHPFYRVDNSITRRTEGTGLGLAICSRIVQLMNGKIAIEPEDETANGTAISFTAEFDSYTN
ncbi:ATP-binding protein [Paenibacillus xylanilyticus]|uniref:ATP-binding protein n=1 Tax=Paenibacillus xylanilyticus TaxID=248903 RepID=UPI0039A3D8FD